MGPPQDPSYEAEKHRPHADRRLNERKNLEDDGGRDESAERTPPAFPTEHLHGSNQHEGGRNHEKCDVDMIEDVPPARPLAELLEPDHHAPFHHEMERLEDGAVESHPEQRAARSPALANEESCGPGVEGLENE